MIKDTFNTFLYEPLYNGLIFLTSVIPGADIGIAVLLLTLIVKFAILPLTHASTKTQVKMRELNPKINEIKKKYKDNKEEQARKTMELYQEHKLNPFSGCITIIIQIPIILALYWVFFRGLHVDPELVDDFEKIPGYVNTMLLNREILYSFINIPDFLKTDFLGLVDMTGRSYVFALIAGISQYYQTKIMMPGDDVSLKPTGSLKDDLARSMKFQMRYILPIFVFVFAYIISAAVALYWATSNIFMISHEYIIKRSKKDEDKKESITAVSEV